MKTFKTTNFLVRGFEEDSSICYLVDTLSDDRMGYFEVVESKQQGNANVLAVYLNMAVFKEVFLEYQKQLNLPVFFWDGDRYMTSEMRQALMSMKAKHKDDTARETRWYNNKNNKVYQLGEYEKK